MNKYEIYVNDKRAGVVSANNPEEAEDAYRNRHGEFMSDVRAVEVYSDRIDRLDSDIKMVRRYGR